LFYQSEHGWIPTTITAFNDDTFLLAETNTTLSIEDIDKMFSSGTLSSSIDGEFQISIPHFAELTVSAQYQVTSREKRKEIRNLLSQVKGKETTLEICRRIYHQYLVDPTTANREKLRQAYEAVPEHERMYLGDMDTKDADYVRILYQPGLKREV
jgi:hypothetical protein